MSDDQSMKRDSEFSTGAPGPAGDAAGPATGAASRRPGTARTDRISAPGAIRAAGVRPSADLRPAAAARPAAPRIGGVALQNGLILVSERYWSAAVRNEQGVIETASGRKPRVPEAGSRAAARLMAAFAAGLAGPGKPARPRAKAARPAGADVPAGAAEQEGIPFVRGLGRLAETMVVLGLVKLRLPAAELPLQGGRVAGALAGSVAATSVVKTLFPKSPLVRETGMALAAFVPAVLALKNSSISSYHGAEHKVIGGLEAAFGGPAAGRPRPGHAGHGPAGVTGGRAASRAARKEHDRCGTNLVGPYLLATVASNLILGSRSGSRSPLASGVAGVVSLGAALEALRWAGRHGDSLAARLLLLPGRSLQRHLTTTEPTPEQLEVGERALRELLRLESS